MFRYACDATNLCLVVGTLVDALPKIAALLSVIWCIIMIIESRTARSIACAFRCGVLTRSCDGRCNDPRKED